MRSRAQRLLTTLQQVEVAQFDMRDKEWCKLTVNCMSPQRQLRHLGWQHAVMAWQRFHVGRNPAAALPYHSCAGSVWGHNGTRAV